VVDRLIEKKGSVAGGEAKLIELIAACGPVSVSDLGKRRSLGAVYTRNHQRRRTVQSAIRVSMVAGVLLAAGGATAAFGVRWLARPTPAPVVVAMAPAPVRHATHARVLPAPVAAPAPETPEVSAPSEPTVHRARLVKSEDPSLVVSALQALRQDHDPERAGHLLGAYLRTYPRGALAEEAVALSIEAADARHSPSATTFAQRYLKEYPHGRFGPAAERVLARPAL
jgi:hypothetical protein